ncbi:putative T7SS-secreted protein [Streptomyces sp. NPDC051940]|uniref:putative T7SS-secreted protein n=1 Tax=Streptomyces sp. NPDC051940 TaxID=3155675 RepID=UPI003427F100
MGFGDFVSDITPDVVEDAVEDATEWAGDKVEGVGNWAADRLDEVGWESGADWVRENSRSLANQMGAEVDEMQLGETEDRTKLVYGSSDKLTATASHLRDFGRAFDNVGRGLQGLDSAHLKGAAADAFRDRVTIEPPKWFRAAQASEKAAGALENFAGTVTWAQGQAQLAIDKWKSGQRAADEHDAKVEAYNDAVRSYNDTPPESRDPSSLPPRPGETNPGIATMQEAQDILTRAREQRNAAAETARGAVQAARDAAPPKPDYSEQLSDGLEEWQVMRDHFNAGIIKGAAGIVQFARQINPTDPYNLTHPAEYLTNLNGTVAGLVTVANDPWGAGRQMVTDFMKDPAEGLGRLVPDLALTAATGGAGAGVRATRVAADAADLAQDANRARRLVDDVPGGHNRPDCNRCTNGTEPVDLATGRMFLPQTDVELPGLLPLAVTRRFESGYTLGRFFGPSWSSTVDERLLVDAMGVVHVTADGLLITYPHPVPGLSTRPETGIGRSRLERTADGDYTLTDPETGLVRHFTAPPGTGPGEDGTAWLAETADRNGHRITIDRTPEGTPLALTHSGGYRLTVTTSDAGRVTALSLDGTALVRHGYDEAGNLATVTRPSGAALTFTHDAQGRITSWVDSNTHRYDYVYDDRHRVIAEGGGAGHFQLTLAYGEPDPATGHRITELTTAAGHTTRHLVDDRCRVVATTDPLGHTSHSAYDKDGRLVTHTDPLGHTTRFGYDEDGRLTSVTRPDGTELRTVYGDSGLPVEFTGPDGARRRVAYDARGNRTSVTDAAGHATTYTYDERGLPTAVTDPLGAVTRLRCTPAGLPEEITDPVGGVTRVARDALGRVTALTGPTGATTRLDWTPDGRLARRTTADGARETWTYDGEGNCTAHTDATGRTTRAEYGPFDRLTARVTPDGERYEFGYDSVLRLTSVTNPQGLTWSYEYDAAGRLVTETDFDRRTLRYLPDAAGRPQLRTTALGEEIRYERDPLGRVVRQDAAGSVTTYAYDPAGRLVQAAGPDTDLVRQYDRRGLLKTELVGGRATSWTYDAAGRRTRRVTPTGQVTVYGHDEAGRRTHLTTGGHRVDFVRDTAGREVSRSYGEILTVASVWDEPGRLTGQRLTGGDGGLLNERAYTYQADGLMTSARDLLRGRREFSLDAMGRVTAVTAEGWTESYAYDAAGNQTLAAWPSAHPGVEAQGERVYRGTRVLRAGANRYEHDDAGRLVRRTRTRLSRRPDVWSYAYDAENRLTSVTTPDGTVWRYRYDPLGRRTAKQRLAADGRTVAEETAFTWDDTLLCEQTTTAPGQLPHPVVLTWDHQGTAPLAQTERMLDGASQQEVDARFFAIATDLIGTPTELVDESGALAWHTRTTLWGTTTWNRDATAYTPLRFPGQYYDPETGLHYNLHRYYDPETGRYTTPDPLGLAPAPNPAAYVRNPHTSADPLGLYDCEVGGPDQHLRLDPARGDVHGGSQQEALDEVLRRFDVTDPDLVDAQPVWGRNPNLTGPSGEPWEELTAIDANGNVVSIHHHANGHLFTDVEPNQWSLPHYHGPNGEHVYYGDMNSGYGLQGRPRDGG